MIARTDRLQQLGGLAFRGKPPGLRQTSGQIARQSGPALAVRHLQAMATQSRFEAHAGVTQLRELLGLVRIQHVAGQADGGNRVPVAVLHGRHECFGQWPELLHQVLPVVLAVVRRDRQPARMVVFTGMGQVIQPRLFRRQAEHERQAGAHGVF